MKTLMCGVLALAAGALLGGSAQAQIQIQIQPGENSRIQIHPALIAPNVNLNPLGMLTNKEVQKDLKFTEEQAKKVDELAKKYQAGLKDAVGGHNPLQKRQDLANAIKKEATDLLQGEQSKRLAQLEIQQKGLTAFREPAIVKDLDLTQDQKNQATNAATQIIQQRRQIAQEAKGNQGEIQKKIGELTTAAITDFVKGLSKEQQQKWQDLTGAPFQGVLPPAIGVGGIVRPVPLPIERKPLNPRKVEGKIL